MTDQDLGSPADRLPSTQQSLSGVEFDRAVGGLGDGTLRFPPPFDLTTSALLAANGVSPEQVTPSRFRIRIEEVIPDSAIPAREVVDTTVGTLGELLLIVDGLVEEEAAKEEAAKEEEGRHGT